jgi:hypothetical protein
LLTLRAAWPTTLVSASALLLLLSRSAVSLVAVTRFSRLTPLKSAGEAVTTIV